MDKISINNLSIGPFNKFSIDFEIGSFSVIAGSNKSGKSLLIKILDSLIYTKNKVFYVGKALDLYSFNELNDEISFLNLESKFSFNTVLEEIKYPLEERGFDKDNISKIVKSVCNDLGITDILSSNPLKIGYFEKVKVILAKSMVLSCKVLLLDDPCKYLNSNEKEEFIGILNQYVTMGCTVIMTTSNLEDVIYTINSTLYILNEGSIVSSGAVLDVLSDDSLINKVGLELPFMVDLCIKLKYYELVDKMVLDPLGLVNILWK